MLALVKYLLIRCLPWIVFQATVVQKQIIFTLLDPICIKSIHDQMLRSLFYFMPEDGWLGDINSSTQ